MPYPDDLDELLILNKLGGFPVRPEHTKLIRHNKSGHPWIQFPIPDAGSIPAPFQHNGVVLNPNIYPKARELCQLLRYRIVRVVNKTVIQYSFPLPAFKGDQLLFDQLEFFRKEPTDKCPGCYDYPGCSLLGWDDEMILRWFQMERDLAELARGTRVYIRQAYRLLEKQIELGGYPIGTW